VAAPVDIPVEVSKIQEEEKKENYPQQLKGPRPKGMKKFKAVVTTSEQPVHEEISESQQRKLDQQKKKMEAEIAAKKEAERLAKQKEDERKIAEQKKIEEEYRRRTEEMFKNLSKA